MVDWVRRMIRDQNLQTLNKGCKLSDLVKIVQDFHSENGRVPTTEDIKVLHRQGKAPGRGTFDHKGGLNWVIQSAGLQVSHEHILYEPGEVLLKFRRFVRQFRAKNKSSFPSPNQCEKELGFTPHTFKFHTGKTYQEALISLGAPARKSKLS